jgi:L-fuconolactonase
MATELAVSAALPQMTIDSHQHFWRYDPARGAWITDRMSLLKRNFLPEELQRECDANGIDATIAVQADQSENETLFLLDLAEHSKRIAGVVGWVDFRSPRLESRLQFFSQFKKLCGFRHIAQAESDDRFLLGRDFIRGIARLREFNFTYDLLIYPRQLPAAVGLVTRFPEQRFVVDSYSGHRTEYECILQGVRAGHRSRLASLEAGRFLALPGCCVRCIWPGSLDVRF